MQDSTQFNFCVVVCGLCYGVMKVRARVRVNRQGQSCSILHTSSATANLLCSKMW
jgi:hypothetical protein